MISLSMLLNLPFTCFATFGLPLTEHATQTPDHSPCFLPWSLPNHCQRLRAFSPRFAQNLVQLLCAIRRKILSCQIRDSKLKEVKINTSTQQHRILYAVSQDLLVLTSNVVSHYWNCCRDGKTIPENYGYIHEQTHTHTHTHIYIYIYIQGLSVK
jgi:hypothetical protein